LIEGPRNVQVTTRHKKETPVRVAHSTPPLSLMPECRYEMLAQLGTGGQGFMCRTIEEVQAAVKAAVAHTTGPTVINVLISPQAQRKPQEHDWLTRAKI